MCTSSAPRKVVDPIVDNPLVNIGSDKPALVKVGGSGAAGVGVGNVGSGFVQAGGRGEKGAPLAVGRVGSKSAVQVGGKGTTFIGATSDKGFQFAGLRTTSFGLKPKEGTGSATPPDVLEPPSPRGRSQELAVETAKAAQKRRLALLGLKRFILTSGRGDVSAPILGRKALLGR